MLQIGWAVRDFTPQRPALLQGQMHVRVAADAMDPLTVAAMALEGGEPVNRAVVVSCDIAFIPPELQAGVRERVCRRFPELSPETLFLCATHTHTSLVLRDEFYTHPGGAVMRSDECLEWLTAAAADAACDAWSRRAPRRVRQAFGHAVVGHNRRAAYADGSAAMYGKTDRREFSHIEGYEDHSLDMLFTWESDGKLAGVALAIPCPSQVDEHLTRFSADFWHDIRIELRRRLGDSLMVLPLCGAAGDQSPHFLLYAREEEEMRRRRGLSERQEIAVRVADAVERALACTPPENAPLPFAHRVRRVSLTPWRVTREQRDWAEAAYQKTVKDGWDLTSWWPQRLKNVVAAFERPYAVEPVGHELHALRIGSAGLVTNPFELYLDYSLRIKARSPAAQTFVVQLAAGWGWYLPTERAVSGGSYGAMPAVSQVGPEGGQEWVEASLVELQALFPA
jgi:hypothetical protein